MDINDPLLCSSGAHGRSTPLGWSEPAELLEEDEDEEGLDFDAEPRDIAARIESCASWMSHEIGRGALPEILIPTGPPTTQGSQTVSPTTTLSLLGRHAESADRFARLWAVLEASHELLCSSNCATQRSIYYRLKPHGCIFRSQAHLAEAIQDTVRLLRVPRSSLGITCCSKGLVGGHLLLHDATAGITTDCSVSPSGIPIPGDIATISALSYSTSASVILIVEKDSIFQQILKDSNFMASGEAIVVTGKGVPDVATRAFVARLHAACPTLRILGLVDWNPSGIVILMIYRFGSHKMTESIRYALPRLRWLGARAEMLRDVSGDAFHELGHRDVTLVKNLKNRLALLAPSWLDQLRQMEDLNLKADLEAIYTGLTDGAAGFGALLANRIDAQDWI